MLEMTVTKKMYDQAKKNRRKLPVVIKGSITDGKRTIYGMIAEQMYQKLFPEAKYANKNDYDFFHHGLKVEVKGMRCVSEPLPDYSHSIPHRTPESPVQECDLFFFCRVHKHHHNGWVMGWCTRKEFLDKAVFIKEGDSDPTKPQFKAKCDCWSLKYEDMHTLDELYDYYSSLEETW